MSLIEKIDRLLWSNKNIRKLILENNKETEDMREKIKDVIMKNKSLLINIENFSYIDKLFSTILEEVNKIKSEINKNKKKCRLFVISNIDDVIDALYKIESGDVILLYDFSFKQAQKDLSLRCCRNENCNITKNIRNLKETFGFLLRNFELVLITNSKETNSIINSVDEKIELLPFGIDETLTEYRCLYYFNDEPKDFVYFKYYDDCINSTFYNIGDTVDYDFFVNLRKKMKFNNINKKRDLIEKIKEYNGLYDYEDKNKKNNIFI